MKRTITPTLGASAKLFVFAFIALLFAGAVQQVAQAQVLYGSLVGRVEDPSGAVMPGARVTVTNKATGQQREAVADDGGAYAFRDLQVGTYDLNITQSGFKSYTKSGVIVSLNTVVREDVQMTVGGTAVYLASDYGRFTTGEIIRVDGGYHVLGMPQQENMGA